MAVTPQPAPDQRHRIKEGRLLFGIPCGALHRHFALLNQLSGQQGNDRVQGQECWRRPRNRLVRPLSLRFNSKMRSRFFKGYFHRPSPHEPFEYLLRFDCRLGTKAKAYLNVHKR